MNKYRRAFSTCLAGGPIVVGSMLLSGSVLSTSLIFGFMTVVIALSGMHLGLWVKSTA